jgi:dihydroorotate dehydrogenase electron transfer subunit
MTKVLKEKINQAEILAPGICRLRIKSAHVSQNALPGQFVNVASCDGLENLLRRPISICDVFPEKELFDMVFMIRGCGTEYLSKKEPGAIIDLIGPLGHGFHMPLNINDINGIKSINSTNSTNNINCINKVAVVGGGIGIFPLLFLLKRLNGDVVRHAYLGFRSQELAVLLDDFERASAKVFISSDDGSIGEKGFITDLLAKGIEEFGYDMIYTCGPAVMMKKVAALAAERNIPCQVSLEQRMGCGIGACLACACKTRTKGEGWEYSRVCCDGPVFWADKVIFD